MNFLLAAVNAKYIHSNPAIYSLREYVSEENKKHISIAEYTINQRLEQILADIFKRKPDAIGFSCYIWNWELIKQLTRELHKILPHLPIWLGGPEVSYEFEMVFEECPEITGIMVGEGEETFRDLIEICQDFYQENAPKSYYQKVQNINLPGLATKRGFGGFRNMLSMDQIPFYYTSLSEAEEKQNDNRIVYYETSRGCPFRCSYCLSSIEKQVRLRSFSLVKEELQFFLDKKVAQVKFIDRTFNCNHEHAKQIWRYIKEKDNGITNFHFEISADLLDEEELQIISDMRPGLIQLEIGVQTTNPQTLQAIHRASKLDVLKEKVRRVNEFGNIHQHLDLIAGLPFEGIESFRNSFNEVYQMKPQQLQLGFLKVLKGSEMYERAEEYGIVYQSLAPYEVLYTKWLSYEEVQKLKGIEEMVELFYNSNQFTHTLLVLEKLFDTPYDLFEALAWSYEEHGYFINSPARAYRYQVLLQFFIETLDRTYRDKSMITGKKKEALEALCRELLTFDLYLRENAKSRPDFCKNLSELRVQMTDFYKKQDKEPDLLREYKEKGYDSKQMFRMTHMDYFSYPVWDSVFLEKTALEDIIADKHPQFVLFDYEKRSPLTHEATYYTVEI